MNRRFKLGALLLSVALTACSSVSDQPVRITIPQGSSFKAAADSLEHAGVISSSRFFRWYASFGGRDRIIKPGTYSLYPGSKWNTLVESLVKGDGLMTSVTIPEGFDLRRIVPRLASALSVPEDSVRAAVSDSSLLASRGVSTETLEGYLFPDTYLFSQGTSARRAVLAMLERFDGKWKPEWDQRVIELNISKHEAVTMAALVEKEARVASERPVIAAVYWNRVKRGMRLQADPTVQYALPEHVERVLFRHLEIQSPYNTYVVDGLPPGPIASPGEASLEAALYPADVPYLFFVAHPDGHHEFRRTFAEHQQAIAMVRREARRRSDGP